MREITAHTLGYHDMFSARYGKRENLTVLQVGGATLVIEAPYHTIRSLFEMKSLRSKSSVTKIDAVIATHVDADHIAGIDLLIWSKVFEENSKLLLITHPEIAEQIWQRIRTAFEISRIDMETRLELKDYVDLVELRVEELLTLPAEIQKRLYLNHIPFVLEKKILQRIKETSSPMRIANALNDITI